MNQAGNVHQKAVRGRIHGGIGNAVFGGGLAGQDAGAGRGTLGGRRISLGEDLAFLGQDFWDRSSSIHLCSSF